MYLSSETFSNSVEQFGSESNSCEESQSLGHMKMLSLSTMESQSFLNYL